MSTDEVFSYLLQKQVFHSKERIDFDSIRSLVPAYSKLDPTSAQAKHKEPILIMMKRMIATNC